MKDEATIEKFLADKGGIDGWLKLAQEKQLEQRTWFERRANEIDAYGSDLDVKLQAQGYAFPNKWVAVKKQGNLTYEIRQGDGTLVLELRISVEGNENFPFYWSGGDEYGYDLGFSHTVNIGISDLDDLAKLEREIRIKAREALASLGSLVII